MSCHEYTRTFISPLRAKCLTKHSVDAPEPDRTGTDSCSACGTSHRQSASKPITYADHRARGDGADSPAVVFALLCRVRMSAVSRVVTRVQLTRVADHATRAVLAGSLSLRVGGQVEAAEGEVDHAVQVAPEPLLGREALQVPISPGSEGTSRR